MAAKTERELFPDLESYLKRSTALDLARRSMVGAPVYALISLIMLAGTPVLTQYGWWAIAEGALLVMLAVLRIGFAVGFESRYDRIGEQAVAQFCVLTALQSLTLGILGAIVIWYYWAAREAVLTIVLSAGCIAAGTSALSIRQSARLIFLACVLLPLGVAVALVGGLMKAMLIVGFLLLMAILVQDGGEARRQYLDKLKDHYRDRVKERRAELEGDAKRQFLENLAHEVRASAYSIGGLADLLLSEKLPGKAGVYARGLKDSCSKLLNLVTETPDEAPSRPAPADPADQSLGTLDLLDSVKQVSNLYRGEATQKGLQFSEDVSGLPERVLVRGENHLDQVLANLLANAVNYSQAGSIKLRGECRELEDGEIELEFTISDTGAGIPESKQKELFRPFKRGRSLSASTRHSSGLGLPLCKDLVETMGGRIELESAEGRGTTVRFTIRAQLDPSTQTQGQAALFDVDSNDEQISTLGSQCPHHILVVDDDEVHRQILCAYLSQCGYAPRQASDGQQAITALMNEEFDLVFMDLRMPGMDGVEATRWIREHFDNKTWRLHIVALTADASMETRFRCLSAGVDNFLTKPLISSELEKMLRKARVPAKTKEDDIQVAGG